MKPHWFQSQGGSTTCTPCLHAVILRVTSGATTTFSINVYRCLLCEHVHKHVYSRLTSWISLMQTVEGRQHWIANLGSSEIRSRASRSSEYAIHSASRAGMPSVFGSTNVATSLKCIKQIQTSKPKQHRFRNHVLPICSHSVSSLALAFAVLPMDTASIWNCVSN